LAGHPLLRRWNEKASLRPRDVDNDSQWTNGLEAQERRLTMTKRTRKTTGRTGKRVVDVVKGADEGGTAAIGVDVGDKYSHLCVIGEAGEVVEETRLRTTETAFQRWFKGQESARVALETGTHSPWLSRLLEKLGHEVIVANARKLRLISESDSKRDRTDAELLARVARVDPKLLAPIEHRSEEAQIDMSLVRARFALVRTRTLLVNHVRGAVKSLGARLPKCSTSSFADKVTDLPKPLRHALAPVMKQVKALTKEIKAYDKRISKLAEERYPQTQLLAQVRGVGPITALCFVLTIGDPTRFKNSRAVGSYFGLRPRQDDSGGSEPELRITKAGDGNVRRLLVQCAQYILGPFGEDSDLRRWGLELAGRGGKNAKKRAIVAVARKLSVLLHRLWITAEVYEPLRKATRLQAA
jgi:transposase